MDFGGGSVNFDGEKITAVFPPTPHRNSAFHSNDVSNKASLWPLGSKNV